MRITTRGQPLSYSYNGRLDVMASLGNAKPLKDTKGTLRSKWLDSRVHLQHQSQGRNKNQQVGHFEATLINDGFNRTLQKQLMLAAVEGATRISRIPAEPFHQFHRDLYELPS